MSTSTKPGPRADFNFPTADRVNPPREGSMRAKVVKLLSRKNGATLAEVAKALWPDEGDSVNPRKPYEAVRLCHKIHGFGLEHDQETGRIKIRK